jgi:hypothetical protein
LIKDQNDPNKANVDINFIKVRRFFSLSLLIFY